jgi:acyl-CoA dehydrogenase-like protein
MLKALIAHAEARELVGVRRGKRRDLAIVGRDGAIEELDVGVCRARRRERREPRRGRSMRRVGRASGPGGATAQPGARNATGAWFRVLLAAPEHIAYSTRGMRYEYTREQLAWRDEVRAFCAAHVTDALRAELRKAGNEGDGPLAKAFHGQLFERGWWGVGWPKEFGGMGKVAVEQYIFIDEMQMAGAPAMYLSITSVARTILREGTEWTG